MFPIIREFWADEVCNFCRDNTVDELRLGVIFKRDDLIVHFNCLMFANDLEQNGTEDNQSIIGFLTEDIRMELQDKSHSICTYCGKPGAVTMCVERGCEVKFHFPCGIKNQSFHQFFGHYNSYCSTHRVLPVPNMPAASDLIAESSICVVCQCDIEHIPSFSNISSSCCKTAWFHKDCIQGLALSAGYFFKCPHCNNQEDFRRRMLTYGIYIPDQDASWELEPNASFDVIVIHNSCDADQCLCEKGRNFTQLRGRWRLILCYTCGSQGVHNFCGKRILKGGKWSCNICSPIVSANSVPQKPRNGADISVTQKSSTTRGRNKRRQNSSIKNNNLSVPSTSNEQSAYSANNLLGTSSSFDVSMPTVQGTVEPGSLRTNELENDEETKPGEMKDCREFPKIKRMKCNIGDVEVRIPPTYKNLLKDFKIILPYVSSVSKLPSRENRYT